MFLSLVWFTASLVTGVFVGGIGAEWLRASARRSGSAEDPGRRRETRAPKPYVPTYGLREGKTIEIRLAVPNQPAPPPRPVIARPGYAGAR
jgi:hypothetical protein